MTHDPSSHSEGSPPARVRLVRWVIFFCIGFVLGNFWLEPLLEPVAVGTLYKVSARSAPPPRVRFINLGHLYETFAAQGTRSALPSEVVQKLLLGIEKLPPELRPAVIGVDFPVGYAPLPGVWQEEEQYKNDVQLFTAFKKRTGIPVRYGVPLIEKVPEKPLLASSLMYSGGESAPFWYGSGDKSDTLPTLGVAVALEAMGQESLEPERPAHTAQHDITPPTGFPTSIKTRWGYVDYSLLEKREELTITPGSTVKEGDPLAELTPEALFSEEDRKKLQPTRGRTNVWFLGVTDIPEKNDIFVYDPRLHWLGDAEPVRRIYQHGALAHTYRESPLRRLGFLPSLLIDVLCSLCGLLFVLHHDRKFQLPAASTPLPRVKIPARVADYVIYLWGGFFALGAWGLAWVLNLLRFRRLKSRPNHRLVGVLAPVVLLPVCILVSMALAWGHNFWFGFAASTLYGLVEPILDSTVETLSETEART